MTKKYRFISDPGHGWLEVPMADYLSSGYKASTFSYVDKERNNIYLEEDCDANGFASVMASKGIILNGPDAVTCVNFNSDCFVRRLPQHDGIGFVSPFAR